MSKPVIAMPWNSEFAGYTRPIVKAAMDDKRFGLGCTVHKVDVIDADVSAQSVKMEVEGMFKRLQNHKGELERKNGERSALLDAVLDPLGCRMRLCSKVREVAAKGMRGVDALMLPGGHDINPWFYGQQYKTNTKGASFYEMNARRSVLEFNMLSIAMTHELPVMGICRGSQIINVFLGGALQQHVPNHFVEKAPMRVAFKKSKKKDKSYLRKAMGPGDTFKSFSFHHQANDENDIAPILEVVAHTGSIVKAMESKHGAPIIALQIHPEIWFYGLKPNDVMDEFKMRTALQSTGNRKILKIFAELCIEYQERRAFRTELTGALKDSFASK